MCPPCKGHKRGKDSVPPITRQARIKRSKRTPSLTALESSAEYVVPTAKDSGATLSRACRRGSQRSAAPLRCQGQAGSGGAGGWEEALRLWILEQPPRKRKGRNRNLLFQRRVIQKDRKPLASPAYHRYADGKAEGRNLLPRRRDGKTPGTKEVKEDRGIPERTKGARICRESFLTSAASEAVPKHGTNAGSQRSCEPERRSGRKERYACTDADDEPLGAVVEGALRRR